MNSIDSLLNDMDYIASLLDGPCRPQDGQLPREPLRREWIDAKASEEVTKALDRLLPEGMPYICRVIVEKIPI